LFFEEYNFLSKVFLGFFYYNIYQTKEIKKCKEKVSR
jgi:hypothetical protein